MLVGGEKATLLLGHFGSGKSEVAVNLALFAARQKPAVTLVDLDLVNPYFRSRDATPLLRSMGIDLVLPETRYLNADLPILVPQVRALLEAGTAYGVIDVGGDDTGARVLGSICDSLVHGQHRVLMVLNHLRPFSDTVRACLNMKARIEDSARVKVDGFVSNAHMMEETDVALILAGHAFAKQLSGASGLPLEFITAPEGLAAEVAGQVDVPVLSINRRLLPPWLMSGAEQPSVEELLAAVRGGL